jgi:transcriptional regulator with XRE-family HTH domain
MQYDRMQSTAKCNPLRSEGGRTVPVVAGMEASVLGKKRVITTTEGAEAIGRRLAEFRKARGITQVELAERLGVSQAVISQWEKGRRLLHGELIATFAELLRVSADELLGVKQSKSRKPAAPIIPAVDKGLARKFALLQSLSRRDRETVSRTIDALVAARAHARGHAA